MDSSDAGILKLYKKNRHQGLELLYERYKKYVYTIAYHYTSNKEDALDLTQDVFVSIFKSLDQFKVEFSLLPWVKKITINKCLNYLRDKKEAVSLNETVECGCFQSGSQLQDLITSPEDTESLTFYRDTREALLKAINKLPPQERMAVILRHMKGMRYDEIAKSMELPLGTIKTFLHRGRKSMKESMIQDGVWEV